MARSTPASSAPGTPTADSPVALSRELLAATKTGDSPDPYREAIAEASETELARVRTERRAGLAFWINCYNAGTQLLLAERPELYDSALRFIRFFYAPAITVGGTTLSLDRIENGLLRGGRSKFGLGYVPKLFVTAFERRYSLETCDPRIHFALNCGAESCPPIRTYDPERIDDQLDLATRSYLDQTVEYDAEDGIVRVPRVFLWFRGDFGGGSGIRAFLRRYDLLPEGASPAIRHRRWDWSKAVGAFVD